MGRKTIPVDRNVLAKSIEKLESERQFDNPSKLYEAVCDLPWAKDIGLTPAVVYIRVRDWNLVLKTQKGKRKGNPNFQLAAKGVRKTRAEKIAANAKADDVISELDKHTPERYKSLVGLIKKGSAKAAIKLNCLECCQYVIKEIRECEIFSCPMWNFRPYQSKENEDENIQVEEESVV